MSTRKYSKTHIREWCETHFPQVDKTSDNVVLEQRLRKKVIEGSTFFDKYPISTNRTLHCLRPKNKYVRYFTNRAKVEHLGFENFYFLCLNGGCKYTNEYQYATVLSDFVHNDVFTESQRLLKKYMT